MVDPIHRQYHGWYAPGVWTVFYLPEAATERMRLDVRERNALDNAVAKLQALGADLGYPHTSAIQGADRLRELRPRAGRCAVRALYRQVRSAIVIAAIAPEAQNDRRGFAQACRSAESRLANVEEG
jgi:hypothetical protein